MMPKRPPSRTYRMLLALWHNSASESLVAPPSAISAVVQHASGITRERAVMSANGTKRTKSFGALMSASDPKRTIVAACDVAQANRVRCCDLDLERANRRRQATGLPRQVRESAGHRSKRDQG